MQSDSQSTLFAGHCSDFFGDGVSIGGILLDGTDGEYHSVDKVYMHQDYPGSGSKPHDIALVKLSTRSSIQPAKIAQWPDMPVVNGYVTAIGFGDVADGGPISQYALRASLRVPDFEACHARYPGNVFEKLMFCTDTPTYDKDTCQGDSGSKSNHASSSHTQL
jgi:secreted trypsin-like serine protease